MVSIQNPGNLVSKKKMIWGSFLLKHHPPTHLECRISDAQWDRIYGQSMWMLIAIPQLSSFHQWVFTRAWGTCPWDCCRVTCHHDITCHWRNPISRGLSLVKDFDGGKWEVVKYQKIMQRCMHVSIQIWCIGFKALLSLLYNLASYYVSVPVSERISQHQPASISGPS